MESFKTSEKKFITMDLTAGLSPTAAPNYHEYVASASKAALPYDAQQTSTLWFISFLVPVCVFLAYNIPTKPSHKIPAYEAPPFPFNKTGLHHHHLLYINYASKVKIYKEGNMKAVDLTSYHR